MNNKEYFTYSYNTDELSIYTEKGKKSKFDHTLESCWEDRVRKNCFRYTLNDLETRRIPGKYGFIAQLNIKRAVERRKPQFMSDIIMPFDHDKFHFGKVDTEEILFKLEPVHWKNKDTSNRHLLIINVSPLEYCNSLLVPSIENCCPQVLNLDGLKLALEVVLLSHNPSLRIGMNSLGAYASVNHLHFHAYYLKETLYLQYAPVKQLISDCYELEEFPSEGFAFQLLDKENILPIARSVMKLVQFLQKEKIAHNIFITRGSAFSSFETTDEDIFNAIRIFVWARKSSFGSKDDMGFNPALCELAGHLPIKEKKYFENVTERDVVNVLQDVCHEVHGNIKDKVGQLFK